MSIGVVQRLLRAYTGVPKKKLTESIFDYLYVDVMPLVQKKMPAMFISLAPMVTDRYYQRGHKLSRDRKRFVFVFEYPLLYLGLKPTIKAQRLKIAWMKDPNGLMVIFEDDDVYLNGIPVENEERPPE